MSSITTLGYAAVKDGRALTGTKGQIVRNVFSYNINRVPDSCWFVECHHHGFAKTTGFQLRYTYEFIEREVIAEVEKDLFAKLPLYGYHIYRDLGF